MFYLFQGSYLRALDPVRVKANIIRRSEYEIVLDFQEVETGKTITISKGIKSTKSLSVQDSAFLWVTYPVTRPDLAVVPALKRPFPVVVFLAIHLLLVAVFVVYVIDFVLLVRSDL